MVASPVLVLEFCGRWVGWMGWMDWIVVLCAVVGEFSWLS